LEIPLIPPSQQTNETHSTEDCQCFVQVKSTRGTLRSRYVKLSNWKRLVETTLPAFFLILQFNAADKCTEAYLTHVWEQEIVRLDDRIWKLAVSREPLLLHRHKMKLSWGEHDRLPSPTGTALRARIIKLVGNSPSLYAQRKADLKKASGHNTGRGRLTVKIAVPEEYRHRHPDEFLVDTLLGLTAFPDPIGGEITHVQFSIPKSTTRSLSKETRLLIGPSKAAASGELVLSTSDREHEVTIPADVRGPSGLAHSVDPSARKLLFTLPHARLVFSEGTGTGTFYFSIPAWEEATPLSQAMHLARLLTFVQEAETAVDVSFAGNKVGTLAFRSTSFEKDLLRWVELVHVAHAACTEFGLPVDMAISTRSLLEQQSALDSLAMTLPECSVLNPAFTFSLNEGSPQPKEGTLMCMPIYADLTLGNKRVVAFESLLGEYRGEKSDAGDFVVRIDRAELEVVLKLGPNEDLPEDRAVYLDQIGEKRAAEGGVLRWWKTDSLPGATGEVPANREGIR